MEREARLLEQSQALATEKHGYRTLVIDSINFNEKTWLDYRGLPHGEKLKTQERYTLAADGQTINGTVVIDDPDYYARPWTTAFTLKKLPGATLRESTCADDHRM